MPRSIWLNLGTTKGAVSHGSTVTRKYRVDFPFKIRYLRLEFFPGQKGELQTSVRAGPAGDDTDKCVWKTGESCPEYYYGDAATIEFHDLTVEYPAGWFITAIYKNISTTDDYSGSVSLRIEEVSK